MSANRIAAALTWLAGAEWHELGERHERSNHAIAGLVVLLGSVLAWLISAVVITEATHWPMAAIVPLTLVFGLLVGAVSRAVASGPVRGWSGVVGRAAIAIAVGVVVGELAALALFSGSIDRRLDEEAARLADSVPAVAQASADLDRMREARTALDDAVEQAQRRRDEALVIARCEFNPSPGCPQTHITGVPGPGPENRTANDYLADSQRELDTAQAGRDSRGAELDAQIAEREQAIAQNRRTAIADADRGLGARWTAMNEHTLASPAAMVLRLLTIGLFALLTLLPLIVKLWRGETSHDRGASARAERERAELEAETAIAVKRAEVRAATEILWAEQQLASARVAVEAQTEIDGEQQRRRVIEALEAPTPVQSERVAESVAQLPAGREAAEPDTSENLPARVESGGDVEPRRESATPLIPTIPDVTKAAARWIRPFVPPIIASAIETATKPLRAGRQVFEETEEIHVTLKRSHKVTVHSEESGELPDHQGPAGTDAKVEPRWVESAVVSDRRDQVEAGERHQKLTRRDRPRELSGSDGSRQPPAD